MSRIRDLLMDRIHNPKPIAHWDFSRYKDSDMTASVNYVKDLTGNGYDLRLNKFDFSTKSGFEGYAQDFNKVQETSELVSKSKNVIKFTRAGDSYNVIIDKGNYNNTAYIVKVILPEGVSELRYSCYVGNNYADYGLSSDRQIQSLVNGINIVQPFSDEYFNNAQYIAFFPGANTDEPCIIEQFPLNPFSLVFNNCAAITKKAVALPVQKGFTFIANRKYLDKTIRTILWGKYLTGGDTGYIIGDYYSDSVTAFDPNNIIFSYGVTNRIGEFAQIEDGISWFSDKLYDGEIPLNKGTYDNVDTPLCIGNYNKLSPDDSGGYGHYAISEAWVFNKTLTKEQVERFIAENATPLPQVYYDVEKQGTLDSDTNKGKIIDFSGNNNHGTLNNFTYDSYYTDEVNSLKLNSTNAGDSTFENKVLTILNNNPGYILVSSAITEGTTITVPSFKIKVTGVTNDKYINILWQNADGADVVSTIKSDGEYTINRYTVTVNGNTNPLIVNAIGGSFTELCTIEFLENSNGWGDYPLDKVVGKIVVDSRFKGTDKYFSYSGGEPSGDVYRRLKDINAADFTKDIKIPSFKIKITGLSLRRNIENDNSSISVIWVKIANPNISNSIAQFTEDGIYEIPSYVIPLSAKTDDTTLIRQVDILFSDMINEGTPVYVELLPSNVEPSYISNKLHAGTNQSNESALVSGHTVTYTVSVDNKRILIGFILIKESNIKGKIKLKSYGGLDEIRLTKQSGTDYIIIGDFTENDTVEINITQDYIDKGYNFIMFRTASAVTAGDKFTVELLPDLNNYIQFDDSKGTHISLDTLTEGFKTVFMVCEPKSNATILYDQRTNANTPSMPFAVFNNGIVYNSRNNGGVTYINGELNTSITSIDLLNVKHCFAVVNDTVTDDDSTTPIIGDRIDNANNGQYASTMKLYKFLGFKEALSEKQIQRVIERYGLKVS